MEKILKFFDNFEENMIAILLPLMCIVVFMATFFRYTQLLVIPWAEELSRYMLVWIIFLGIGTGAKKNAHFSVEVFVKIMPKSTHKYFSIFRTLVIVGFCSYIIHLSTKLIGLQLKMGQTSPALNIPMWVPYLAVPIGCTVMIIRTVQHQILSYIKSKEIIDGHDREGN